MPVWETVLVKAFGFHKRCYGTRQLPVALRHQGTGWAVSACAWPCGARALRALQPKAYTPRTTDSTHSLRCAPNWLLDQPKPTQANRAWVSDSTYLPLADGTWAYLCAFQNVPVSRYWVGTWRPQCPKNWLLRPCNGLFWPNRPPRS